MPKCAYITVPCIAFLFSVVLLSAQPTCQPLSFSIQYLDYSSGLSSARVNSVTQDQLGFWWLGTEFGLQRFNGKSFQTFRHQSGDASSLPDNVIRAVHADKHNRLWVATPVGICRYLPATGHFKTYQIQGDQPTLGFPSQFLEDSRGDLWLAATGESTLFRLQSGSDVWERYPLPAHTGIIGRNIGEDRQTGNIWLIYKRQDGIACLGYIDRRTGRLTPGPGALDTLTRNACHFGLDPSRGLWSSRVTDSWYPDFLFRYDLSTGQTRRFNLSSLNFSPLFVDRKGQAWFFKSQQREFGFINPNSDSPTVYCWPQSMDGRKTLSTDITCIYEDREGNIWISTNTNGVFVINTSAHRFLPVYENFNDQVNGKIRDPISMWESPEGKIWVGTYNHGTYLLDQDFRLLKKIFTPVNETYDKPAEISDRNANTVWSFSSDLEGNIWAGCQAGVLMQFSPSGELLWKGQDSVLAYRTIRCLSRDNDGYIWVGTQGGLLARLDPKSRTISRFEAMDPSTQTPMRLYKIIPDKEGWLWLVYADQVLHYHTLTKSWKLVQLSGKTKIAAGTGYEFISGAVAWGSDSLLVYGRNLYWLDKNTRTAREIEKLSTSLTGYVRFAARARDDLILAFSTGAARWSMRTGRLVSYSTQDGLPDIYSETLNVGCYLRNGHVVLGMGGEGAYFFQPDSVRKTDTRPPNVLIDGMWVNGRRIALDIYASIKNLRLRHSENFLRVAYACATMQQQQHLRFRYRLIGYSREWVDNGGKRSVELTGLTPGRYVLEIQVRNREGLEALQVAQLPFSILPPWYLSWPALIMYVVLLILSIYRLYHFQLQRKLELAESTRLREMTAFKSQFYTNITHEFRTPLTIILGMAEEMENNPDNFLLKGIAMIRRNSNRLLELVNQVLELSKLESGQLELRLQRGDGIRLLKYLTENYSSFAASREVNLSFSSTLNALEMDFDTEKVQQIMDNLLSNAIKFTPAGGEVCVDVQKLAWGAAEMPHAMHPTAYSEGVLAVTVKDTGIGMAAEELKHIFDRYYQVKNTNNLSGTGVGLTLALEFARWMEGDITVESEVGKGSIFTFYLPILRKTDTTDVWAMQSHGVSHAPSETFTDETVPAEADSLRVLLIEDNPDVLQVLRACLHPHYQIDTAENGRIGLEKAQQILPDLIVSDVMMPEMDGRALCTALKQDIRTSHIPVILLTARAGLQNKLEGLDLGADDYLVKPFEKAELLARMRQLTEQRKRLRNYYLQQALTGTAATTPEATVKISQTDEAFLAKIKDIVESHYSNADFGIGDLEMTMAMSHAQFYRKFTALMGISAVEYLRRVRIQKAQELLQDPDCSISDVAFSVGFNDPAFFSRVFKSATGLSPNEWRNSRV